MNEFLTKMIIHLWGSALILAFVACLLAFISYDVNDPSWNNVVEGTANNLLGLIGSHGTDLLIQTLGLASYFLAFPLLTWGWRIISLKGLPFIFMHLLMLPFLVMSASLTLSVIPPFETWVLDVGLCGILGQILLDYVQSFFAWSGVDFYPIIVAIVFGALTLICLFYT